VHSFAMEFFIAITTLSRCADLTILLMQHILSYHTLLQS